MYVPLPHSSFYAGNDLVTSIGIVAGANQLYQGREGYHKEDQAIGGAQRLASSREEARTPNPHHERVHTDGAGQDRR